MARVIVVGSINQDVTVTVDRFPTPGETLSGSSLTYGLGGKGANQAAAAARSGIPTLFVGAVGTDLAGHSLRTHLAAHGVDVSHLREVDSPSGTALITVAASGENTIILDAGANRASSIAHAKASLFPAPSDIVVLQAEIPPAANAAAIEWAHSFGARVLLNLAPARATDPATLSRVEARHSPAITLGEAVDTTGAGDACVGALAAALALGKPFDEAVADGMRAGAAAVLAPGAAASYANLPRITRN